MVRETFNNDQQFIAVLDKACAAVINYKMMAKHHCRSPELVRLQPVTSCWHDSNVSGNLVVILEKMEKSYKKFFSRFFHAVKRGHCV